MNIAASQVETRRRIIMLRKATMFAVALFVVILSVQGVYAHYSEAPMLWELVKEGKLPPVEERLPSQPLVVEPVEAIGKYGGTAHTATTRPTSWGDDTMMMGVWAALVQPTFEVDDIVPHIIRDFDVSDEMTVFTFYMREGMKWSDGHPFTAEDIQFWYEDILHNEDLTPVVSHMWRAGGPTGPVMDFNLIDKYTFQFVFATPAPLFINELVDQSHNFIRPKHYLKQFHVHYVAKEELKTMAAAEGLDEWYELFAAKDLRTAGAALNPDRPSLAPYVAERITSDRRQWVRNPYFWKVDSAGNQLPYIDRINCTIVSDREVLNGMIISGALDFAGFESDIRDYPIFMHYASDDTYRVELWKSALNEVIYQFNMTHNDPILREIFSDKRFRQALSLAIDREEINELIYHGQGKPSQFTVIPSSKYYKPEFTTAYVEYDPDRANALLDEMGLDKRDSEGFRLRPDGERLLFTLEYMDSETPNQPNVELVTQYWNEVGVDMRSKLVSSELQAERATANLMDATVWHGDASTDIRFPISAGRLVPTAPSWSFISWTEYARWFHTAGAQGEEPPEYIKELYGWYNEAITTPDEGRSIELFQKILQEQADNVWSIGTIAEGPFPLVVRANMRNVPVGGYWSWDNVWISSCNPEQFFFDE